MNNTPAVGYPRGVELLESVADALMKMFSESLAVQSRIDTDAILATVTTAISERVPATCMAILMKSDPGTSRIVVRDQITPEMAAYVDGYVASLLRPGEAPTTGLSQRVIESGTPVFMPSVGLEELLSMISTTGRVYFADHPLPITTDAVGVLMVPMRSGPATVGTLSLFKWQAGDVLTTGDVEWMQKVADRTGLSAENAQLRNRAMDRLERVNALGDVALAITSSQDLRVTLNLILEHAVARLRVDAADVLLVDDANSTLFLAASAGFRSSSTPDFRFPIPEDVPRRALFERHIGSSMAVDWMGQHRRWVVAREGLKTYTAAPLTVREKLVGALELFSRRPLEPDPEWLAFLDAMASQAAIAVDNATIHDELRRVGRAQLGRRVPAPLLSPREREILSFVVDGASNREVAEKLHLSQNTIKFHVRQLLEKAKVSNRTELATKAAQQGWL